MLTDAQASAWLEEINREHDLLGGTQVKIRPGQASISTNLNYQGIEYPVFAAGEIQRVGPRSVAIHLVQAKLGKIEIPAKFLFRVERLIERFINQKLGEVEGLEINQLILEEGFLQFKGKIPQKAVAR